MCLDHAVEWLLTSGSLHNEFVKSHALAAGLGDSGAGSLGEAEGSNSHLGQVEDALVVSDGADGDGNAVSLVAEVLDDLGERKRGAHSSGGHQSSQDGLGEHGVGSAGQESEQLHTSTLARQLSYLHEQVVVKVLAVSVLLVLILESASGGQIDTLSQNNQD